MVVGKKGIISLWLMLSCFYQTTIHAKPQRPNLTVAVHKYDPWHIIDNNQYSGITLDYLKLLAERSDITLTFVECPFARCLKLAQLGEVDLLASIFKSESRQQYLQYLEPALPIENHHVFYYLDSSSIDINKYSDLSSLTIGTLNGAVYFDRFDKDTNLVKVPFINQQTLYEMVLKRRLDAFIANEIAMDYLLKKNNVTQSFKKSSFRQIYKKDGYIALSKKSRYLLLVPILEHNAQQLKAEGVMGKNVNKYVDL